MLKIEKTVLPSPEQWEILIEGMRNPKNSWDRMDSYMTHITDEETMNEAPFEFFIGEADQELMETLAKGGPVHGKYLRMIPVWVTLTAPLYFWKEFDTYKIGTVRNSCSTMHKIDAKEFTFEDFSCEHLCYDYPDLITLIDSEYADELKNVTSYHYRNALQHTIDALNSARDHYLIAKNRPMRNEAYRKEAMKR